MTGAEVAALLGLAPLPHEGGMWAQTWIDEHSTAIYFLMQPGDFSAVHRLDGPEIWHHYAGAPARMLVLHGDGTVSRRLLGDELGAGERPCVVVPSGDWMAAETLGEWTLVGTTMAPPYTDEGFQLGDRAELTARYPEAAADIVRLTREES
jgi:predicted cupin superfamily sugar epimerase